MTNFRETVREWIEDNCPPAMRTPMKSDADACWGGRNAKWSCPEQKEWLDAMASKGWTAPRWPTTRRPRPIPATAAPAWCSAAASPRT